VRVGVLTRSGGTRSRAVTRCSMTMCSAFSNGKAGRDCTRVLPDCARRSTTPPWFVPGRSGTAAREVRQVVGDARTAYVRIARRGIFQFDGQRATPVTAPKGVSFVDATSLSLGADRALWVAGPGFVVVRRDGKWERVPTPPDVSPSWAVIVADGAGAFVGSVGGVVLALNRGTDFRVSLGEGLPSPAVASLRPDGLGNAWFVSAAGLVSANAPSRRLAVENSPPDAEAVDFSPSGGLLVASRWTVSRKNEGGWADLAPDVEEIDPAFTSVFAETGNVVWAGARSARCTVSTAKSGCGIRDHARWQHRFAMRALFRRTTGPARLRSDAQRVGEVVPVRGLGFEPRRGGRRGKPVGRMVRGDGRAVVSLRRGARYLAERE